MKKKVMIIILAATVLIALTSTGIAIGMNNVKTSDDVIKIKVGQVDWIMLEENPSTGYMWVFDGSGNGIAEIVSDYYAEGLARPGAAGQHIWKVKGLTKGETTLTFSYERSWEENSAIEQKTYTIIVK